MFGNDGEPWLGSKLASCSFQGTEVDGVPLQPHLSVWDRTSDLSRPECLCSEWLNECGVLNSVGCQESFRGLG